MLRTKSFLHVSGLVAVVLLAISLTASPAQAKRAKVGSVQQVTGRATVVHSGETRSSVLKAGLPIYQMDTIKTLPGAKLRIVFHDQSAISLGPNTSLKIDEFVFDRKKKVRRGRLSLLWGKVKCIINDVSGYKNKNVSVTTHTAVIGVRGTEFLVLSSIKSKTTVAALKNAVDVANTANKARKLLLEAGKFSDVLTGQEPTSPLKITMDIFKKFSSGLFEADRIAPEVIRQGGQAASEAGKAAAEAGTQSGVGAGDVASAAAKAAGVATETAAAAAGAATGKAALAAAAGVAAAGAAVGAAAAAAGVAADALTSDQPAVHPEEKKPVGDEGRPEKKPEAEKPQPGASGQGSQTVSVDKETVSKTQETATQPGDQAQPDTKTEPDVQAQTEDKQTKTAAVEKPAAKPLGPPVVELRAAPKAYKDKQSLYQVERRAKKIYKRFKADHPELAAPADRFIDNGDGTVTDRATGLMWEMDYKEKNLPGFAHDYAQDANRRQLGGYNDWRLPTSEELAFLMLSAEDNPDIPIKVPIGGSYGLWTGDQAETGIETSTGYTFAIILKGILQKGVKLMLPADSGTYSMHHVKAMRKVK